LVFQAKNLPGSFATCPAKSEAKLWRGSRLWRKGVLSMTIEKAVGQELHFWRTKKGLSQEKLFKFT
jgi:hypothetical protein